jgi:NADH-quinone oxidoreductase subunit L
MTDIKRVLAYSTISQLGYMMLGLGVGGVAIGIFHLFNHAFFKALLFLGAGSVNHATGTFDMRLMGGLRKLMPWTYATFLIASLSIIGIWPLSGFWSKDEILSSALDSQPVLFYLAMIAVFITAFYMFRVVFITFGGKYRGENKPHESSPVMLVPMALLSLLAIGSGWFNVGGGFASFLGHGESHGFLDGFFGVFSHPLTWVSLLSAAAGVFLAYAIYSAKWLSARRIRRRLALLHTLLYRKYWLDDIYERLIARTIFLNGLFAGFNFFDSRGVDGVVNGVAGVIGTTGRAVRKAQTGQLQLYGMLIALGIIAIVLALYLSG